MASLRSLTRCFLGVTMLIALGGLAFVNGSSSSSTGGSGPVKGVTHRIAVNSWPLSNYTYLVGDGNDAYDTFLTQQLTQWQQFTWNDFFSYTNMSIPKSPVNGVGSIQQFPSRVEAWSQVKNNKADGRTLAFLEFPEFLTRPFLFPDTTPYSVSDFAIAYLYDFSPVVAAISSSNPNIKNLNDFLTLCKQNPGMVVTGGGPSWSVGYIAAYNIMRLTGVTFTYKQYESDLVASQMLLNGTITVGWIPLSYVWGDSRYTVLAAASDANTAINQSKIATFRDHDINYIDGIYRGIGIPSAPAPGNAYGDILTLVQQIGVSVDRMQQAYGGCCGVTVTGLYTTVYFNNRIPFQNYSSPGFAITPISISSSGAVNNPFDAFVSERNFSYYQALTFTPVPFQKTLSTPQSQAINAMLALAGVGILLAFIGSYAFYYHRAHPVFVAASLPFCSVMILGFVLGYISMIILSLDPSMGFSNTTSTNLCRAFPVTFGIAFNLIFGALFAKTWRLVTIFYNKALVLSRNITNASIAKNVGLLVLMEIVFHVCWLLINPLSSTIVSLDDTTTTYSCQCSHQWVWMGIFIASKVVLLTVGIGLAIKTRNLDSQFNESKSIGFSLYNIFFCALIAVPFVTLVKTFVTLQYVIMNFAIWLCLTICLAALLVPKVLIALGYDENQPFSFRKTTHGGSSNPKKAGGHGVQLGTVASRNNSRNNSSNQTMGTEGSSAVSNLHLLARSGGAGATASTYARNGSFTNVSAESPSIPVRNIHTQPNAMNNNLVVGSSNNLAAPSSGISIHTGGPIGATSDEVQTPSLGSDFHDVNDLSPTELAEGETPEHHTNSIKNYI